MELDWKTKQFNGKSFHGVVINKDNYNLKVIGETKKDIPKDITVFYWAANPIDTRFSYPGSGQTYSSPEQAYDRSVNMGLIDTKDGKFSFNIKMPNSYYIQHGAQLIPPHVHLKILHNDEPLEVLMVALDNQLKQRLIHNPKERTSANFYNHRQNLPFRSQEQILRDSSLPVSQGQCSFWGLKPPQ